MLPAVVRGQDEEHLKVAYQDLIALLTLAAQARAAYSLMCMQPCAHEHMYMCICVHVCTCTSSQVYICMYMYVYV